MLGEVVVAMRRRSDDLADRIGLEAAKPPQDAKGEVGIEALDVYFELKNISFLVRIELINSV